MAIQLSGRITERGELEIRLPEGLPPGEVRITIEIPQPEDWNPEILAPVPKVEPLTGAEMVKAGLLGGWEDQGIWSSETWLKEQRRRRREQHSRALGAFLDRHESWLLLEAINRSLKDE